MAHRHHNIRAYGMFFADRLVDFLVFFVKHRPEFYV